MDVEVEVGVEVLIRLRTMMSSRHGLIVALKGALVDHLDGLDEQEDRTQEFLDPFDDLDLWNMLHDVLDHLLSAMGSTAMPYLDDSAASATGWWKSNSARADRDKTDPTEL